MRAKLPFNKQHTDIIPVFSIIKKNPGYLYKQPGLIIISINYCFTILAFKTSPLVVNTFTKYIPFNSFEIFICDWMDPFP